MSPSMPQPTSIVTSSTKPTSSRGLDQGDKGAGKGDDDDDDVVVDRKVILILLSVAIGVMILGMIIITVAICCVFQRIK